MEKKKKRPERKLSHTTIIALVVIVVASVAHVALLWLTPNRPDYYDGNIIYPVMKYWLLIDGAIFITVIGAYFAVARLIPHQLGCGLWLLLLVFNFTGVCLLSISIDFLQWDFKEYDNTKLGNNVYYLILTHGSSDDFDSIYGKYIVYECDSWGIACQNILVPVLSPRYSYIDKEIQDYSPTELTLSNDKSELYVIIGEEEFLVATQSP